MQKLTKQQLAIYSELQKGYKVTNINTHHRSGGQFVWAYNNTPVGYKAFWGLMRALYGFENARGANVKQYFV